MRIGRHQIEAGGRPYIIAELGVNHDGSIERALELVEIAAKVGADAIKLQLFEAKRLLSRAAVLAGYQRDAGAADPATLLGSLELRVEQIKPLIQHAHNRCLHAIVTIFSVELVEGAQALEWDAFKIASPDLINRPLLESLMRTDRPLLVSAGAATLDEVALATQWLGDYPHVMLQCVSSYPAPDEFAALRGRAAMLQVNVNALGYSDHTQAVDTGALAVASGAVVLEKHLTHDRRACGPDHAASLDPGGFAEYVRLAHRAYRMLGNREKAVLPIEHDVRRVSRQSITTTRLLPAGHRLQAGDLTIKRPGIGIEPAKLSETIGRTLARGAEADMPLCHDHLQ